MPEHVLITGGAGFIGSHLADALLAEGHQVTLLDPLHPQVHGPERHPPDYLNPAARLVLGDVRDPASLSAALDGVDVVYHFAAHTGVGQSMYQIREYLDVNAGGTAALLEQLSQPSRRVRRLVLASSRAVYGEGAYHCDRCGPVYPRPRTLARLQAAAWDLSCPRCGGQVRPLPTPETAPAAPRSIYAATKLNQEQISLLVADSYGLPVVVLRFFNVYGPRQSLRNPYTGVINTFVTRLLNGQPPQVYEDGHESRDFVHVADVCRACLMALAGDAASGQVINVGSGRPTSLLAMATLLSAGLAGPAPVVTGRYRAGDIRHCHADLSQARSVLGYEPQVPVEQGLAGLLPWLAGQRWADLSSEAEAELVRRGLSSGPA